MGKVLMKFLRWIRDTFTRDRESVSLGRFRHSNGQSMYSGGISHTGSRLGTVGLMDLSHWLSYRRLDVVVSSVVGLNRHLRLSTRQRELQMFRDLELPRRKLHDVVKFCFFNSQKRREFHWSVLTMYYVWFIRGC